MKATKKIQAVKNLGENKEKIFTEKYLTIFSHKFRQT